nr:RNA-directed DNA polymerase, eukaryota [Tanacetum cinerariifolium]
VVDMDRLIGNLCTIWVGRFHLHANVVRYERPIKSSTSKRVTAEKPPSSFNHRPSGSPALVLDDSYVNNVDFSRHVMGSVKELNCIPNLRNILMKEGFLEVQLSYLGGLWVMMDVKSEKIKRKMLQHTGVNSWFHDLLAATHDLVINERIVWVDIEGLSLNLWSSASFSEICQKWGNVMDIEESPGYFFARKRLCIMTSMADNILETFKVIFKGKVYSIRAKELFTWTPCFL